MDKIEFTDNKAAINAPDKFLSVEVDIAKVLKSWKGSVFSFEWLDEDGQPKAFEDLGASQSDKLRAAQTKLASGEALEKPVLGIGMLDNIEVGSGHAAFIIAAAMEHKTIAVHIPKSNESDFKDFLAGV